MKQMGFIAGVIVGFGVATLWIAYDVSKSLKTGKLLGDRYQIIDHGKQEENHAGECL